MFSSIFCREIELRIPVLVFQKCFNVWIANKRITVVAFAFFGLFICDEFIKMKKVTCNANTSETDYNKRLLLLNIFFHFGWMVRQIFKGLSKTESRKGQIQKIKKYFQ